MRNHLLLISVLLLSSCESPAVFSPNIIQATGEYTQTSTGQVFPESLGSFSRVGITGYNAEGSDIGVGYNHSSLPIAVTLYSYPAPAIKSTGSPPEVIEAARNSLFVGAYNQSRQDIILAHQNNELVAESTFNLHQNDKVYSGRQAAFNYTDNFAGQVQPLLSHLYLFQAGDYLYKYRVTHPANMNVENEITTFMEDLIIHESL